MQPYSINIDPVAKGDFPAAVDSAVKTQGATWSDEVRAIVEKLAEAAKTLADELIIEGTHVGAYIAGAHASGTENTGLREQHGIQFYAAPAPPSSTVEIPAAESAAVPGGLFDQGGSMSDAPFQGGPGDMSAGASPIPTALGNPSDVPDGSSPTPPGTVPAEQVDPEAEISGAHGSVASPADGQGLSAVDTGPLPTDPEGRTVAVGGDTPPAEEQAAQPEATPLTSDGEVVEDGRGTPPAEEAQPGPEHTDQGNPPSAY